MNNFFTDQLPLAAFVHQLLYNLVFVNRSCFIAYHILDILIKRVYSIEGKMYSRKKDLFQNRTTGRRNTLIKTFFEEIFLKKKIVEENFLQKAVRGIHHFLHTHVITLLIFVSTLLSVIIASATRRRSKVKITLRLLAPVRKSFKK